MKILVHNPGVEGKLSGPMYFMRKLIDSIQKQQLAKITFKESDADIDAMLSCIQYPSANIARNLAKRNIPTLQRLDGIYSDLKQNITIKNMYDASFYTVYQSEYCKNIAESQFRRDRKKPYSIILNGAKITNHTVKPLISFPKDKFIFVTAARWHSWKGMKYAVESVYEAIKEGHNVGLILAGTDVEKMWARNYKDLHPDIRFIGTVEQRFLKQFYTSGDCLLFPGAKDCCPNVVVEGICEGLPCICDDTGGTPEIVQDAGIVVKRSNRKNRSVSEFKDAIIQMISDYETYKSKARMRREDLNIDNVAKKYIQAIVRAIELYKRR